jgi:hypothetical protein
MELLFLTDNLTTLYPQTLRRVELLDKAIFDRIQKWIMFSAIWELDIEDFFGKKISYKGIKYEGSPESVYWYYFKLFLISRCQKFFLKWKTLVSKKVLSALLH